jgi:hypothetical protein
MTLREQKFFEANYFIELEFKILNDLESNYNFIIKNNDDNNEIQEYF